MCLRASVYFHDVFCYYFFVIPRFLKGIQVFLGWETISVFETIDGACCSRANKWMLLAVFQWHVLHHLVAKRALPSCLRMHYRVLFLMRWRMMAGDGRFIDNDHFFSLYILFFPEKMHVCPLIFKFVNLSPLCFLLFIFILSSIIYIKNKCFQFSS